MQMNQFKDENLSRLGFGAMRLPLKENKEIDEAQVKEMVDYAMSHGVNYFDTAYPYHDGKSEIVMGKILSAYPRDSYYLATKYPGHQVANSYNPEEIFEEQLKKCGVEYFDFYLLHNVYENSIGVYTDKRWGIMDYFVKQKELGRIKYLGFSSHARPDCLEEFLKYADGRMDFCQIQLNYLDWTLQDGKEKYELLEKYNVPVWVMESVRGGRLANLSKEETEKLLAHRPNESTAAWSLRWLMGLPNVKMILSGMSDTEQMKDNVKTFSEGDPLSEEERAFLLELAEGMKGALPCTACRYCTKGCPMGLDIPRLISGYNDIRFSPGLTVAMQLDALPDDKLPSACIGCGACSRICPQKIDIPAAMKDFTAILTKLPKWADICRQRAAAAKALHKD